MQSKSVENKSFTLYTKILDFNDYVRKNICNNIPNIHRDIRIHLLDECYNLAKLMFSASYNKGNVRRKYLTDLRVNLSLIDMLLAQIKNLGCIKNQTINTCINKITSIKNIIYGWIINEENQKY